MNIELYLISPHEEYAEKHACRKHWNYQWRGRRGSSYEGMYSKVKLRKESFGGLLMNSDGKLYKVDKSGYDALEMFINGRKLDEVINTLNVSKKEASQFFNKLEQLGIMS